VPHYHVVSLPKSVSKADELCLDDRNNYCAADPDGTGPATGEGKIMVIGRKIRESGMISGVGL
jgi:hypothetical protein